MYIHYKSPEKIYLKKSNISNAGYGVFTKCFVRAGELLECAPFIELPREFLYLKPNILQNYVFSSHNNKNNVILVFGYGSMYNHSLQPNARYTINDKNPTRFLDYSAIYDIPTNTELLINYGPQHHMNIK